MCQLQACYTLRLLLKEECFNETRRSEHWSRESRRWWFQNFAGHIRFIYITWALGTLRHLRIMPYEKRVSKIPNPTKQCSSKKREVCAIVSIYTTRHTTIKNLKVPNIFLMLGLVSCWRLNHINMCKLFCTVHMYY